MYVVQIQLVTIIDADFTYIYSPCTSFMRATSTFVCTAGRVPLDPLLTESLEGGGDVLSSALDFPSQHAINDIAVKIIASVYNTTEMSP